MSIPDTDPLFLPTSDCLLVATDPLRLLLGVEAPDSLPLVPVSTTGTSVGGASVSIGGVVV